MSEWKSRRRATGLLMLAAVTLLAAHAAAEERRVVRIPLGRAEVVVSDDDVKTVAIAEPKTADAAVGSARTVVVNAKAVGRTSLVVYTTGGRYSIYDVEVFVPNADKEVLLSVRVAEVNANARRELGFDFAAQVGKDQGGLDGTITGGIFTGRSVSPGLPLLPGAGSDGIVAYRRNDGNLVLAAAWKALEEKGDLRVLASPTLVARSGEKADFLAGGEFPVPIASTAADQGTTVTIEWKEFGVKVDFTPTVLENGRISLKVSPEVSQLDYTSPLTLSGFTVPALTTRRTSTTVEMEAGEHLIIGGLKQKGSVSQVKRVPLIGHIPIIGFFFTKTLTEDIDNELVVVVSPTVIQPTAQLPPLPTDQQPKK